jgi:FlaA1/EpsC-like NDP-sugar epimerase
MKQKENGVLPITDKRMTRFNITLQEGVDFVLQCLGKMWGGELFVPKIPSYRIMDVGKAIAPDCKLEIVGIRPGEKLHEEMITENDAINTIEFDDYFVISPSSTYLEWDVENFLNESNKKKGRFCKDGFRYSSDTNEHFLSVEELRKLIENHI